MYDKILVPLDGSATSERGLCESIELAKVHGSRLSLLHVVDDYPLLLEASAAAASYGELHDAMLRQGREMLDAARARVLAEGVAADAVLRETQGERVAKTIVGECEAAGCGLIVMGTHGRRGVDRLVVGSDAEAVMRTSPVPLLLVRASH